ncbi:hypothetical protein IVG45_19045 [Methylomonas sp. LL1]|uniref:hypothetical protein n=1 Tax=Methylomonas sp. LL1 TaxID=2785785 RepID=UPI0018C42540|nr:hypothetical protein [Methylomonas sp. LL1]QPK62899.1 hypothetical protein IVG45_19045 [Methylomonas sp. LL1]
MNSIDKENANFIKVGIDELLRLECNSLITPQYIGKKSFYTEKIGPRIMDQSDAVEFYKTLDYYQFTLRDSMIFWENSAAKMFYSLLARFKSHGSRSISLVAMAESELEGIQRFFETGANKSLYFAGKTNIEDAPDIYQKLIYGHEVNIFIYEELLNYRQAEADYFFFEVLPKGRMAAEGSDEVPEEWENWDEYGYLDRYPVYFNKSWYLSIIIQVMIWYKEVLKNVIESGELSLQFEIKCNGLGMVSDKNEHTIHDQKKKPELFLERKNEGFLAIKAGFDSYYYQHGRCPDTDELMVYMVRHPPANYIVEGKVKNNRRVEEIKIEGIKNPISRDAFDNRLKLYLGKAKNY